MRHTIHLGDVLHSDAHANPLTTQLLVVERRLTAIGARCCVGSICYGIDVLVRRFLALLQVLEGHANITQLNTLAEDSLAFGGWGFLSRFVVARDNRGLGSRNGFHLLAAFLRRTCTLSNRLKRSNQFLKQGF